MSNPINPYSGDDQLQQYFKNDEQTQNNQEADYTIEEQYAQEALQENPADTSAQKMAANYSQQLATAAQNYNLDAGELTALQKVLQPNSDDPSNQLNQVLAVNQLLSDVRQVLYPLQSGQITNATQNLTEAQTRNLYTTVANLISSTQSPTEAFQAVSKIVLYGGAPTQSYETLSQIYADLSNIVGCNSPLLVHAINPGASNPTAEMALAKTQLKNDLQTILFPGITTLSEAQMNTLNADVTQLLNAAGAPYSEYMVALQNQILQNAGSPSWYASMSNILDDLNNYETSSQEITNPPPPADVNTISNNIIQLENSPQNLQNYVDTLSDDQIQQVLLNASPTICNLILPTLTPITLVRVMPNLSTAQIAALVPGLSGAQLAVFGKAPNILSPVQMTALFGAMSPSQIDGFLTIPGLTDAQQTVIAPYLTPDDISDLGKMDINLLVKIQASDPGFVKAMTPETQATFNEIVLSYVVNQYFIDHPNLTPDEIQTYVNGLSEDQVKAVFDFSPTSVAAQKIAPDISTTYIKDIFPQLTPTSLADLAPVLTADQFAFLFTNESILTTDQQNALFQNIPAPTLNALLLGNSPLTNRNLIAPFMTSSQIDAISNYNAWALPGLPDVFQNSLPQNLIQQYQQTVSVDMTYVLSNATPDTQIADINAWGDQGLLDTLYYSSSDTVKKLIINTLSPSRLANILPGTGGALGEIQQFTPWMTTAQITPFLQDPTILNPEQQSTLLSSLTPDQMQTLLFSSGLNNTERTELAPFVTYDEINSYSISQIVDLGADPTFISALQPNVAAVVPSAVDLTFINDVKGGTESTPIADYTEHQVDLITRYSVEFSQVTLTNIYQNISTPILTALLQPNVLTIPQLDFLAPFMTSDQLLAVSQANTTVLPALPANFQYNLSTTDIQVAFQNAVARNIATNISVPGITVPQIQAYVNGLNSQSIADVFYFGDTAAKSTVVNNLSAETLPVLSTISISAAESLAPLLNPTQLTYLIQNPTLLGPNQPYVFSNVTPEALNSVLSGTTLTDAQKVSMADYITESQINAIAQIDGSTLPNLTPAFQYALPTDALKIAYQNAVTSDVTSYLSNPNLTVPEIDNYVNTLNGQDIQDALWYGSDAIKGLVLNNLNSANLGLLSQMSTSEVQNLAQFIDPNQLKYLIQNPTILGGNLSTFIASSSVSSLSAVLLASASADAGALTYAQAINIAPYLTSAEITGIGINANILPAFPIGFQNALQPDVQNTYKSEVIANININVNWLLAQPNPSPSPYINFIATENPQNMSYILNESPSTPGAPADLSTAQGEILNSLNATNLTAILPTLSQDALVNAASLIDWQQLAVVTQNSYSYTNDQLNTLFQSLPQTTFDNLMTNSTVASNNIDQSVIGAHITPSGNQPAVTFNQQQDAGMYSYSMEIGSLPAEPASPLLRNFFYNLYTNAAVAAGNAGNAYPMSIYGQTTPYVPADVYAPYANVISAAPAGVGTDAENYAWWQYQTTLVGFGTPSGGI